MMPITRFQAFMRRRYGGMETEAWLSGIELSWGTTLLISKLAVWDVRGLQIFYNDIPNYIIALPWLFAGIFSLRGLYLFLEADLKNPPCSTPVKSIIFRRIGATISSIIWPWMLCSTLLNLGGISPIPFIYFFFWVASFRSLWSAWAMPWPK